jgi:hypothetical protein
VTVSKSHSLFIVKVPKLNQIKSSGRSLEVQMVFVLRHTLPEEASDLRQDCPSVQGVAFQSEPHFYLEKQAS